MTNEADLEELEGFAVGDLVTCYTPGYFVVTELVPAKANYRHSTGWLILRRVMKSNFEEVNGQVVRKNDVRWCARVTEEYINEEQGKWENLRGLLRRTKVENGR